LIQSGVSATTDVLVIQCNSTAHLYGFLVSLQEKLQYIDAAISLAQYKVQGSGGLYHGCKVDLNCIKVSGGKFNPYACSYAFYGSMLHVEPCTPVAKKHGNRYVLFLNDVQLMFYHALPKELCLMCFVCRLIRLTSCYNSSFKTSDCITDRCATGQRASIKPPYGSVTLYSGGLV
jgi:hypothetical protein